MYRDFEGLEETAGHGWAEIRGIGNDPGRPLHEFWSYTARKAALTLEEEGDPEGWYVADTRVFIQHKSPGWIDGFRVELTP